LGWLECKRGKGHGGVLAIGRENRRQSPTDIGEMEGVQTGYRVGTGISERGAETWELAVEGSLHHCVLSPGGVGWGVLDLLRHGRVEQADVALRCAAEARPRFGLDGEAAGGGTCDEGVVEVRGQGQVSDGHAPQLCQPDQIFHLQG